MTHRLAWFDCVRRGLDSLFGSLDLFLRYPNAFLGRLKFQLQFLNGLLLLLDDIPHLLRAWGGVNGTGRERQYGS